MKIKLLIIVCCLTNFTYATRWLGSLEQFELKNLSILYIKKISNTFSYVGIVDPHQYVHTAVVGSMIGKNYGQIVSISDKGIEIREAYKIENKENEWEVKTVFLNSKKVNSEGTDCGIDLK